MSKFIRIGNMYINPSELSYISMCKFNKSPENCSFYKSGTQCETCERVRYQIKGEGTWGGLDSRIKTSEDLERVLKESLSDEKYDPKVVDNFLNPPKGFIEVTKSKEGKCLIKISEITDIGTREDNKTFIRLGILQETCFVTESYDEIVEMIKEQS